MLRGALASICLLSTVISQADNTTTVFTKPPLPRYCFPQSEWRGGLAQATFDYRLILAEGDFIKHGDVFVAFRLKSKPDALWLYDHNRNWVAYDPNTNPVASYSSGTLEAILQVPIIPQPTDLTALSGDGELYVGYGLRNNASATVQDSFQEMLSNQRYSLVWEIGPQEPMWTSVCLTVTQVDEMSSIGTASQ